MLDISSIPIPCEHIQQEREGKIEGQHLSTRLLAIFFLWIGISCGYNGVAQSTTAKVSYPEAKRIPTQVFVNLFSDQEGIFLQKPEFPGLWISRQIVVPIPRDSIEGFFTFAPKLRITNYDPAKISVSVQFFNAEGDLGVPEEIDYGCHYPLTDSVFLGELVFAPPTAEFFELSVAFGATLPGESLSILKSVEVDFFAPRAIFPEGGDIQNTLIGTNGSCPCPLPDFVNRTGWNCPTGQNYSNGTPSYANVSHMVVHHSASANTATNWGAVVLSFWNYHTGTRGWDDIGYNWLIDPDGVIYEGRGGGNNVVGAHFCGSNTGTMGICLIGSYDNTPPTSAAIESLEKLLTWKSCDGSIDPVGSSVHAASSATLPNILGHQSGCATACPGAMVFGMLPTIRTEVDTALKVCLTTSIGPETNFQRIKVFPNPVTDVLQVEWEQMRPEPIALKVFDLTGRLIYIEAPQLVAGFTQRRLDLSFLSPGLYHLTISGPSSSYSHKILRQ